MTVRFEGEAAFLEGVCGTGDAEPLFAALSLGRQLTVDLSACCELHGAVAQVLLSFDVTIRGQPQDAFLRDFVAPALETHRARAQGRRRLRASPAAGNTE